MKWYFPAWNGDFRLEPIDDKNCKLVAIDPTLGEQEILKRFLEKITKPTTGEVALTGTSEVILAGVSLAQAGKILVKIARPSKSVLTAVKFTDGKIETAEGSDSEALAALVAKAEEAKKDAEAATSVKRPTPCCPQCQPGSVAPASEVLLEFLTPAQHKDWARFRAFEVEGQLTRHRYVVAHRNSPMAARFGRMCYDADDEGVMHFHDNSVPPEEEALAVKLILEHAEPWLRNEATCLGMGGPGNYDTSGRRPCWTDIFKNPFGDGMDGVADRVMTEHVGQNLAALMGLSHPDAGTPVEFISGVGPFLYGEPVVNPVPILGPIMIHKCNYCLQPVGCHAPGCEFVEAEGLLDPSAALAPLTG